jgi:hypothetical protein
MDNRSEWLGVGLYTGAEGARLLQLPAARVRRWLGGYLAGGKGAPATMATPAAEARRPAWTRLPGPDAAAAGAPDRDEDKPQPAGHAQGANPGAGSPLTHTLSRPRVSERTGASSSSKSAARPASRNSTTYLASSTGFAGSSSQAFLTWIWTSRSPDGGRSATGGCGGRPATFVRRADRREQRYSHSNFGLGSGTRRLHA